MSSLGSWARGKGCVCAGALSCPWQETLPLGVPSEAVQLSSSWRGRSHGKSAALLLLGQTPCHEGLVAAAVAMEYHSVIILEHVQGLLSHYCKVIEHLYFYSINAKCSVDVSLGIWSPFIWSCLQEDNPWARLLLLQQGLLGHTMCWRHLYLES